MHWAIALSVYLLYIHERPPSVAARPRVPLVQGVVNPCARSILAQSTLVSYGQPKVY